MKNGNKDFERGRIEKIKLKKVIMFNGNQIKEAIIEIDHINYGLNKKTRGLNKRKRTNFSLDDVEMFLMQLDEEYVFASDHVGRISKFNIRVDCPVRGRFFKKQFIMIFDTDYDKPNEIHTITIFPGW